MSLLFVILAAAALLAFAFAMAPAMADPSVSYPMDEQTRMEAVVTQTASYNSAAFDLGSGFAPDLGGIAVAGVVHTSALALNGVPTLPSYTATLQQSASGTGGWANCGQAVPITKVGLVNIPGLVNEEFVRLAYTMANGTGAAGTVTISGIPTGGTFTVSVLTTAGTNTQTTTALAYNASAATVQAAIVALSNVGAGNATVTLSGSVYTITLANSIGAATFAASGASLTGGTSPAATAAQTSPGPGTPSMTNESWLTRIVNK
jgi:hypothetical protein